MSMTIADYEEMLKSADLAEFTAGQASRASQSLDEKLRFQKLRSELQTCRRQLVSSYYEFEDAAAVVKATTTASA